MIERNVIPDPDRAENWGGDVDEDDLDDPEQDEVSAILAERQKEYGSPTVNFERIARALNGLFMTKLKGGEQFTATDVASMMIVVKLTRLQQSYKHDTAVDIQGYGRAIIDVNEGAR